MYDIPMDEVSRPFAECWSAAGRHLQRHMDRAASTWLKANLAPPWLEHLSFRLGNQLFFVRIEDVDGLLDAPGIREGLVSVAEGCRGQACLMPMRRSAGGWQPDAPGWGLLDARTGLPLDPPALITAEPIEMTDWELQDFAVQVVRTALEDEGRELLSWQSNPGVDPSIWFAGDDGPEWVVVRAARYPARAAPPPADWARIAAGCARMSHAGHFASVAAANADEPGAPLWRGHGLYVAYDGLQAGPGRQ